MVLSAPDWRPYLAKRGVGFEAWRGTIIGTETWSVDSNTTTEFFMKFDRFSDTSEPSEIIAGNPEVFEESG